MNYFKKTIPRTDNIINFARSCVRCFDHHVRNLRTRKMVVTLTYLLTVVLCWRISFFYHQKCCNAHRKVNFASQVVHKQCSQPDFYIMLNQSLF